ncbi:MAG: DUF2066 domain-containing protein [Xanthomonadales bacterium]|nr:DUF2066 domain-containing protein [Gammaproteobacteria bacterium]MBT8053048.1 DUF2066 domain-containing protein [Gammaproteobacteria bacterium]NND56708.1 DUF2066 domain-containing protein [Xanthomonadales bacterium]NNK52693.1 DUF2066 domain-containing protein [Xanthomonadales bacterium]
MRALLLILLLAALPFAGVYADTIDIYSGEAAVEDNGQAERSRALPLALKHVLLKMSGLRTFEEYPEVEPALGIAASILLSFHYRNVEGMAADGSLQDELRLVARFSADRTNELARSLQLPSWPAQRIPTDIWVVVDNGLDRRVMPLEFEYAWRAMADTAATRGFPLRWPMADEEGQFGVDAQLLWGGYTEDLGIGPGGAAMIVAARREGPNWNVRSNLAYNGQSWTWRTQDIDLVFALTESMQEAADRVSAASSIAAADLEASLHELTVTGILNSSDYIRCLGYLQNLEVVSRVSVNRAQPGKVAFRLELNALPQYLNEALLKGQVLGYDEAQDSYFLLQ